MDIDLEPPADVNQTYFHGVLKRAITTRARDVIPRHTKITVLKEYNISLKECLEDCASIVQSILRGCVNNISYAYIRCAALLPTWLRDSISFIVDGAMNLIFLTANSDPARLWDGIWHRLAVNVPTQPYPSKPPVTVHHCSTCIKGDALSPQPESLRYIHVLFPHQRVRRPLVRLPSTMESISMCGHDRWGKPLILYIEYEPEALPEYYLTRPGSGPRNRSDDFRLVDFAHVEYRSSIAEPFESKEAIQEAPKLTQTKRKLQNMDEVLDEFGSVHDCDSGPSVLLPIFAFDPWVNKVVLEGRIVLLRTKELIMVSAVLRDD
jgi:hypothetical protein